MNFSRHISRLALISLFVSAAVCFVVREAQAADPAEDAVYFQGRLVEFHPLNGANTWTLLRTNAAKASHLQRSKPIDGRPNLYIVAPGTQMHHEDEPGFNHNLVISWPPERSDAAEFDIYYAIVLDPELGGDQRSERDIILAAQQSFSPPEKFLFTDIPGVTTLRISLNIRTLAELDGFRRADGSLPRMIVVPARMMLRAVVRELPTPDETAPSAAAEANDTKASETPKAEAPPESPRLQ